MAKKLRVIGIAAFLFIVIFILIAAAIAPNDKEYNRATHPERQSYKVVETSSHQDEAGKIITINGEKVVIQNKIN